MGTKLTLDLEDLSVETFATMPDPGERAGTVHAHTGDYTFCHTDCGTQCHTNCGTCINTCPLSACLGTCDGTCQATCNCTALTVGGKNTLSDCHCGDSLDGYTCDGMNGCGGGITEH